MNNVKMTVIENEYPLFCLFSSQNFFYYAPEMVYKWEKVIESKIKKYASR